MTGIAIRPVPPSREVRDQGVRDVVRAATGDVRETEDLSRCFGPDLPIVDSDDDLITNWKELRRLCELFDEIADDLTAACSATRKEALRRVDQAMETGIVESLRPMVALLVKGRQPGSMRAAEVR